MAVAWDDSHGLLPAGAGVLRVGAEAVAAVAVRVGDLGLDDNCDCFCDDDACRLRLCVRRFC